MADTPEQPILKRGDHGAFVIQLQDSFVRLGWLSANYVDGHFGETTEELVRRVQRQAVISQTGIFDRKAQVALDGLLRQKEKQ